MGISLETSKNWIEFSLDENAGRNKEPTEFQYFKAWLFFFIVASVCTWLITLVLASFVAAFLQAGGASLTQATKIIQILSIVIAIPVSYVTFRIVVGKYLMPKIIWED